MLPNKKGGANADNQKTNSNSSLNPGSNIVLILILLAPIVFALLVSQDSPALSWNQGRGEFIFVIVFIIIELFIFDNNRIKLGKRFYIVCGLSVLAIGYFVAIEYFGLKDTIESSAPLVGVNMTPSWILMWDFIVVLLFIGSSLLLLLGHKWYKIASASIIYLAGVAILLSLDAFFPRDTLGPLQSIALIYLEIDEGVIKFIDKFIVDLGPGTVASATGNILVLRSLHGFFPPLQVFWPSVGIHSAIIYTLVMFAFLVKIEIPFSIKAIYFIIGTVGTITVNIIRLISLSIYPLLVTTDADDWQVFHSIAGTIMFLPWLAVYLFTIIYTEKKQAVLKKYKYCNRSDKTVE